MDCRTITTWTDENWHFLLGFGKTVAVDTETTGLNYYDLDILGLSLCDGKRACYIDLSADRDQFVTLLREMFQNHFTSVIFHNAPFDISVIEKTIFDFHVKQPRLFDTMVAAHLLDENAPVNLKYLAEHKLQADVVSYIKAAAHGIDSQEFYQYAMNDAIWTWQLHLLFNKQLYNEGLDRLFFEIEMPFQWVLARMR
ncbi:MAG: ribonuclease H-like domain-containing protein, partial [Saccharofermentanales bacterium]